MKYFKYIFTFSLIIFSIVGFSQEKQVKKREKQLKKQEVEKKKAVEDSIKEGKERHLNIQTKKTKKRMKKNAKRNEKMHKKKNKARKR